MRDQPHEEQARRAVEQANAWLQCLERTLKEDEAVRFREWLKTPLHREIIVDRCKLWHGPEILAVLGTLVPDAVASSRLPTRRQGPGSVIAWLLAVCCVSFSTFVLLGGPPWTAFRLHEGETRLEEFYRTQTGDRRELDLPDGASIVMNTATHLFVNYDPTSRAATLLWGEAVFDATRDALRPFRVSVGGRIIEADRARFNLRRLTPDRSEITVVEGTVRVLRPNVSTPRTPTQLRDSLSHGSGEAILAANDAGMLWAGWQSVSRLVEREAHARLAWQRGLIVFISEPLDDALAEVARYSSREFVLTDQRLHAIRLNGQFRTGDIEGVLRTLHDDLRIESRLDVEGKILLTAPQQP